MGATERRHLRDLQQRLTEAEATIQALAHSLALLVVLKRRRPGVEPIPQVWTHPDARLMPDPGLSINCPTCGKPLFRVQTECETHHFYWCLHHGHWF